MLKTILPQTFHVNRPTLRISSVVVHWKCGLVSMVRGEERVLAVVSCGTKTAKSSFITSQTHRAVCQTDALVIQRTYDNKYRR